MNPEEGDLRPQLLDRFALAVEVQGIPGQADRAQVVRRRIAFESDPVGFRGSWEDREDAERARIERARELLPNVVVDDRMLDLITHLCCDFQVDGLRADIVMYKTAATLAAYAGRTRVDESDVREAALLALLHRRRRQPFQETGFEPGDLDQAIQDRLSSNGSVDTPPDADPDREKSEDRADDGEKERVFRAGDPYAVRTVAPPAERKERPRRAGRRIKARGEASSGRYVSAVPKENTRDLALDATLRAAAPHQAARRADAQDGPALVVRRSDLHEKVRESRTGSLVLFAVDASGSMAARSRMAAAKQAVLSLLVDAYQKRDRVGLIAFRGRRAEVLLPPTSSVDLAERRLQTLPTGGRTPLAHALELGLQTVARHRQNHPEDVPLFVMISDGRPNVPLGKGDLATEIRHLGGELRAQGVASLVVDTESGPIRMGMGRELSQALGGDYLPIEQLRAGDLLAAIRGVAGRG
jgi:magnesium chelatase subunit D